VEHFQRVPIVVRISTEVCIVGDIHGNLHDLVRIIRSHGLAECYLFLGDYVDRGPFSLEVMLLLLTLTLKYPDRFFLLRGNHETPIIAGSYGFRADHLTTYPESLFDSFCDVFAWLPLVAIVQDAYFCVHGGICPSLSSISSIEQLSRPIHDDSQDLTVRNLLWADPTDSPVKFAESHRGETIDYGARGVRQFLQTNSLAGIIRGHQCVDGVLRCRGMPVWTVFSASNYTPGVTNRSGVLIVGDDRGIQIQKYPAIPVAVRSDALFFSHGSKEAQGEGSPHSRLPLLSQVAGGGACVARRRMSIKSSRLATVMLPNRRSSLGIASQPFFSSRSSILPGLYNSEGDEGIEDTGDLEPTDDLENPDKSCDMQPLASSRI
jgi:protein phosphatase